MFLPATVTSQFYNLTTIPSYRRLHRCCSSLAWHGMAASLTGMVTSLGWARGLGQHLQTGPSTTEQPEKAASIWAPLRTAQWPLMLRDKANQRELRGGLSFLSACAPSTPLSGHPHPASSLLCPTFTHLPRCGGMIQQKSPFPYGASILEGKPAIKRNTPHAG